MPAIIYVRNFARFKDGNIDKKTDKKDVQTYKNCKSRLHSQDEKQVETFEISAKIEKNNTKNDVFATQKPVFEENNTKISEFQEENEVKTCKNEKSRLAKIESQDLQNLIANNNNINYTDFNDTDINQSINQSELNGLERLIAEIENDDDKKSEQEKRDRLVDGLVDTEIIQEELENFESKNLDIRGQPKIIDIMSESKKRMSNEELSKIVLDEIYQEETLPYHYLDNSDSLNSRKLELAINHLIGLHRYETYEQKNTFYYSALSLFGEAIIEILTRKDVMLLNTSHVTYSKFYEKIVKYIEVFKSSSGDIEAIEMVDIARIVINSYEYSAKNQKIHNPLKYMMSCIWTGLQVGNIDIQSNIKRDFG